MIVRELILLSVEITFVTAKCYQNFLFVSIWSCGLRNIMTEDRSDLDLESILGACTQQRQSNQVWSFRRRNDGTFKPANAMDVVPIEKSIELMSEGVMKVVFGLVGLCNELNGGIPEADFKESVRKGITKSVTDVVLRTETKSMPSSPHMRLESETLGTIQNQDHEPYGEND